MQHWKIDNGFSQLMERKKNTYEYLISIFEKQPPMFACYFMEVCLVEFVDVSVKLFPGLT